LKKKWLFASRKRDASQGALIKVSLYPEAKKETWTLGSLTRKKKSPSKHKEKGTVKHGREN